MNNSKSKILILGAGTAGVMMANHLAKKVNLEQWKITIVSENDTHYYQPGFLFLPFDSYTEKQVTKTNSSFLSNKVNYVIQKIQKVEHQNNKVILKNEEELIYDILIIATGTDIAPDEIENMLGNEWQKSIFDFYTFDGAVKLRDKLKIWEGGKLVIQICEMPIKCPVAPLEFAFLADEFFKKKGIRDKVEISYVTPMSGAFTTPKASKTLDYLLKNKNIKIIPDFNIEKVDNEDKKIIAYGGLEIEFDLLVTVPTNMGAKFIEESGFGDDLNFIPTDKHTLQSKFSDNIFVIGDATDLPASKAGSVAHFQAEVLTENIIKHIAGETLLPDFDGHSNCFIETGGGKGLLIDFNYKHQPTTGTFPIPWIGPLRLLKESRLNHWGKLAFRWIYWNLLLKARKIPFVPAKMNEKGKNL
jgi:sulfide:quinone oxidoreductase